MILIGAWIGGSGFFVSVSEILSSFFEDNWILLETSSKNGFSIKTFFVSLGLAFRCGGGGVAVAAAAAPVPAPASASSLLM